MQYEFKCPKCGKIEYYSKQSTVDKKVAKGDLCENCKNKERQSKETYVRICPECNKKIVYKYRSDYNKAVKRNSLCKHCAVSKSSILLKGHTLNSKYKELGINVSKGSLDRLIKELTVQSFYWIGFILTDGSFCQNRFEFSLKEEDKYAVEQLANYLNNKNPLEYREKTKSWRTAFSNKESVSAFMQIYGFNYLKTYNPCDFSFYKSYSTEQLTALLIGIIDGDGSIKINSVTGFANIITITAHKVWRQFYEDLLTSLSIPIRISESSDNNCSSIRICKREICLMLKNFITSNNLFHLSRKWNKIQIKDPSLQITK